MQIRNTIVLRGIVVNGRTPDFIRKERATWDSLIDRSIRCWETAATGRAACACRCSTANRVILMAIPVAVVRPCGLKIRAAPANAPT